MDEVVSRIVQAGASTYQNRARWATNSLFEAVSSLLCRVRHQTGAPYEAPALTARPLLPLARTPIRFLGREGVEGSAIRRIDGDEVALLSAIPAISSQYACGYAAMSSSPDCRRGGGDLIEHRRDRHEPGEVASLFPGRVGDQQHAVLAELGTEAERL